ncbi:FG-GAP-like repeat-containing protein [Dokdonella sp.]|uniref:FG-GAP-like repeat-containing protein n=1 Tax=Dokdonella sp. TaxID=2291710 RepID=UPI003C3EC67A
MTSSEFRSGLFNPLALLVVVLLAPALQAPAVAKESSPTTRNAEILTLKNTGLAYLEEDKNAEAKEAFRKLAELVNDDPLPVANAAVAALRSGNTAAADAFLTKAVALAPDRSDVLMIGAAIETSKANETAARKAMAKAAQASPRNLEARWRWIRSADNDAEVDPDAAIRRQYLTEILSVSPNNLPALLKQAMLQLEGADTAGASATLVTIQSVLAPADEKVGDYLTQSIKALQAGDTKSSLGKLRIVENLLRVSDRYLASLAELYTDVIGLPLTSFGAEFEASLRPGAAKPIAVAFELRPTIEGSPTATGLLRRTDWKNRGEADIYDVPKPYSEVAFIDFDNDGDLDVYLYGADAPDQLLRNNLDGSWTNVTAATGDAGFTSVRVSIDDFDRDGDLDLACVTGEGTLVVRNNQRQGRFESIDLKLAKARDVAAADLDTDGWPDLVVAASGGPVLLLNKGDGSFERSAGGDLVHLPAKFQADRVAIADLDNDGFLDLAFGGASGLRLFRNAGLRTFTTWDIAPKGVGQIDELVPIDFDADGDIDLLVDTTSGSRGYANVGGNANGWLDVELQGLPVASQKVNRRGVGSLVEIKAGDLYAARTVSILPTHFGLGRHTRVDVLRSLWTNGVPQNLFDQVGKATVVEVQRLKGSCPFVYAKNGSTGEWSFVSDALGRAPIGLLYDGVNLAGADPREWLLLAPGQLAPDADGLLHLDYTEELWEAVYLDMVHLAAVDHPAGTGVVPNERMIPVPTEKKLFTVANPRPLRAAFADGVDVTTLLTNADGDYVEPGAPTAYQGVRTPHELILDLGPVAEGQSVVLYFVGWIFYSDTSINVSLSQRSDIRAEPPVLEVPDGAGGWRTVMPSMGFPAGKTKIMPLDLTGLLAPGDPRVRIRTSLEIWWDQVYATVDDPPVPTLWTELEPARATLAWRGFSRGYRATPNGPELFDHDIVDTDPHWMDIPGKATRYGDVTSLLRDTDDELVVFVGGDAIRLEFDANELPPLPVGWIRDWVVVSDGWDKDFDKNTVTGTTIAPYPFHAMSGYPYPDSESLPDNAARAHSRWTTREVTPAGFMLRVRDHGGPPLR